MKKILQTALLMCFSLSSFHMSGTEPEQPARIEVGRHEKKTKEQKQKLKAKQSKKAEISKSAGQNSNTYHPYYYIKSIGAKGKTLSTYDETVWEISDTGSYTTRYWNMDSPVIIQPNYSWWSSHDYRLKNIATNESVSANLSLGPFAENAIFIREINRYSGIITLSNGSIWSTGASNTNNSLLSSWKVGQAVLIGETDSWFPPYYILVNINEKNTPFIPVSIL